MAFGIALSPVRGQGVQMDAKTMRFQTHDEYDHFCVDHTRKQWAARLSVAIIISWASNDLPNWVLSASSFSGNEGAQAQTQRC